MLYLNFLGILLGGWLLCTVPLNAQQLESKKDSTVIALRVKNLNHQKMMLEKQIALEDQKRNAVILGVNDETLERMNEKQDSICLQLRSDLVRVELELRELGARKVDRKIVKQYNALRRNFRDSIRVEGAKT